MSTQFQRPTDEADLAGHPSELQTTERADHSARSSDGPLGFEAEEAPTRTRHIIDRFDAAAGLFLVRLATAAVMGVHGLQKIAEPAATEEQLRQVGIPSAHIAAMVFGPLEIAIAVALVLGLAVRAAGLGMAAIAISALVLVTWTDLGRLFVANQPGFTGDTEFLLAGVGLMLLGVGGGGWGLDRKVRGRRKG